MWLPARVAPHINRVFTVPLLLQLLARILQQIKGRNTLFHGSGRYEHGWLQMRLQDYERAPHIRGIHGSAATHANFDHDWWINRVREMGMAWYKLIDDGSGSVFDFARKLRQNGIMPVVRIFQNAPLPNRMPGKALDTIARYVGEGVTRWFELLNEPNIPLEWQPGQWDALAGRRERKMVEVWLADAQEVISRGGYPGFPAMAPSGRMAEIGSIIWYEKSFQIMAQEFNDQARQVFGHGAWLAIHDVVLNHCYKDEAGAWHFECPYDEITQKERPGLTIFDGDNSLMGHRVPVTLLERYFGLEVPVIGTEGGVLVPHGGWEQPDKRYPGYDYNGHAERTVAMYRWLERYAVTYPWYFGICPWLLANRLMGHPAAAWREDAWYHDIKGKLPVVGAVMAMGGPLPNPEPLPPIGPSLPLEGKIRLAIRENWQDPTSPIVDVVTLSMEEYLRGVVPVVMPGRVPLEALKAQAVASRSYAYYAKIYPRHAEVNADLCNSAHCQMWVPEAAWRRSNRAVRQTKDKVARHEEQIIRAFYFANCGGRTKNSEDVWREALPYCRSVRCPVKGEPEGHGVGMCREGAEELARRGKGYEEILKHYYTGIEVVDLEEVSPPSPPPSPPPPPPPPPPVEHHWKMTVTRRAGPVLIVGTFPWAGIQITATDPWGNHYSSVSGSKTEYGPGGFEILIFRPATYTLRFLEETFEVTVGRETVHLTFEQIEEEAAECRVISQWMKAARAESILGQLSEETEFRGRLQIDYQD